MLPILNFAIFLPLIAFFAIIPYLSPPDVQFGVRLPKDFTGRREIKRVRMEYSILTALLQLSVLIAYFWLSPHLPSLLEVFVPLAIVPLGFLTYFRTRKKTLEIRGPVDTTQAGGGKVVAYIPRISYRWAPMWFIIPWVELAVFTAIGIWYYPHVPQIMAVHYGANGQANGFAIKSYTSAFTLLLFVYLPSIVILEAAAYSIMRVLPDRNSATPRKSGMQMRGFNGAMYRLFITVAAIIGLSAFISSMREWGMIPGLPILVSVIPSFSIVPVVLLFTMKTGQSGWKLYPGATERPTGNKEAQDDSQWAGGLLYHNKEDRSLIVPKRYGIGYTLNFARKSTWIIIGILAVAPILVLALAFIHIF